MGNGAFCVLKGEYSHVRVGGEGSFDGVSASQNTTWCVSQGGAKIAFDPENGQYGFGCIFKGRYSTVGPMSWGASPSISFAGDDLGGNINESSIFLESTSRNYVILKGEFSVYGPNCYGSRCYTGNSDCLSAGGASFGGVFCAVAEGSTVVKTNTTFVTLGNSSTDMTGKKNTTSNSVAANRTNTMTKANATSAAMQHDFFSKAGAVMIYGLVSYQLILGHI